MQKKAKPKKDWRHYHRALMYPESATIFQQIHAHLNAEGKDHPKSIDMIEVYHRGAVLFAKKLGIL